MSGAGSGAPDDAIFVTKGHFGEAHYFERKNAPYWVGREWDSFVRWSKLDAMIAEGGGQSANTYNQITDGVGMAAMSAAECWVCGRRVGFVCVNPDRYEAEIECPYPGGMPVYDVVISVPSGRLVFDNDLRDLCPIDEPRQNVNAEAGTRAFVEAYATGGMIHIFVGNSCPTVYRQGDSLVVANYADPSDFDEADRSKTTVAPPANRREPVASICTDLWWFSAMDYDVFRQRVEAIDEDLSAWEKRVQIVTIAPGNYAASVEKADRDAADVVFSRITPTDRPAAEIIRVDDGLAATVRASEAYKALFDRPILGKHGFENAAFILTVNGNGYDWKQGFVRLGNSGRDDLPFRVLTFRDDDTPIHHPLMDRIVPLDVFAPVGSVGRKIYPMAHGFSILGRTPRDADPWWLALCLLFAVETKDRDDLFEEGRDTQVVMRQTAHMLCEIVEARGGFAFLERYIDGWREVSGGRA